MTWDNPYRLFLVRKGVGFRHSCRQKDEGMRADTQPHPAIRALVDAAVTRRRWHTQWPDTSTPSDTLLQRQQQGREWKNPLLACIYSSDYFMYIYIYILVLYEYREGRGEHRCLVEQATHCYLLRLQPLSVLLIDIIIIIHIIWYIFIIRRM